MRTSSGATFATALVTAAMTASGCQPEDVTAARDQLGRGGRPQIRVDLPITIDPESVALAFGAELRFEGLTLDPFTFDYSQLLRTATQSTSLDVDFGPPAAASQVRDTVRFATDDGSQVTAATVGAGTAMRSVTNDTSCDAGVSLTFTDENGTVVASFPTETVAAGGTLSDVIALDGSSFAGFIVADADADVGLCVPTSGESVNTTLTFPPLDLASVQLTNIDEPFAEAYDPLASEDRIQAIDTVLVATGQLTLTVVNRLAMPFSGTITLEGITRAGAPLFQAVSVPAASGGAPGSSAVTFNLAGAAIAPADVIASIDGTVQAATATVTAAEIAQAITVSGGGEVTIAAAVGPLDPAVTPELVVQVEDAQLYTPDDVDFGDLDDLLRDAVVDSAVAVLTLENPSGAPLRMSNLVAGITRLDAAGQPQRDPDGDFLFETDGNGAPLLITVTDPGTSELSMPRQSAKQLAFTASALMDRFVHLLNDSIAVALATTGTATAGDGQPARVTSADEFQVRFDMSIRRLFYQRQLARRGAGTLP